MKIVARGKEDVLSYFENQSKAKCGQVGEYLLAQNDEGQTFLFLAGHGFSGDFTGSLGLPIIVRGGVAVGLDEPKLAQG